MNVVRSVFAREKRAIVVGLLAFFFLSVALPIAATILASFGASGAVTEYVAPAKQFQPVLFIVVGAITAWLSVKSAVVSAAFVGFVGGASLFLFAVALGASPHLGAVAYVAQYILLTVGFCSLGGGCVALLRRYRKAL